LGLPTKKRKCDQVAQNQKSQKWKTGWLARLAKQDSVGMENLKIEGGIPMLL